VKNLKFVIGLLLFVGVLVIGSSMTMAQRMPIEDVIIPTLSVAITALGQPSSVGLTTWQSRHQQRLSSPVLG
jgi:hypothetical protein